MKFFLKHWKGPSLDPTYRNYVWTLLADLLFGAGVLHGWYFICFDLIFYTCIILIPPFISMYIMTLHCIYCTFQSRILACWLMLSVAKTTINKVYLILSYLSLSPHKGQWRGALIFHLICVGINGWINNREAGDFRRFCAHYDVSVMIRSCLLARDESTSAAAVKEVTIWNHKLRVTGICHIPNWFLFYEPPKWVEINIKWMMLYFAALYSIKLKTSCRTFLIWDKR